MVPELGCRSVRAKESLNQATLVHDNELYIVSYLEFCSSFDYAQFQF